MHSGKIAVLIACHNRRAKTIACIENLAATAAAANVKYQTFLFDDGSSDGTADAVKQLDPSIEVVQGDGSYFWNRSMHKVFALAMERGFQSYLWLNDDTMLQAEAFRLLQSAMAFAGDEGAIVVGAISDPESGHVSYGGLRDVNPGLRPFLATLLQPNGTPQDVDVMNGNVVLIPHAIAKALGNLDPVFEHGMGDTDYSKRAKKQGFRVLLTAGYVGTCARNPLAGTHHDHTMALRERLRQIFSRKGLPWRSWLTMCWRHGGILWPVHFLWGYVRVLAGRKA
ncbi:glycosyltransferase family 2 protein [Rhodoferax mekongensis]|uniref:glycosyltransferase family 2 protein n=1 Tax=Rhodoferax mekongensis TaxID=3068341 RepID=UPI0028BEF76E|nr:glycosyltransferase family 2 protein [Rhodoferax sp. TBRC 17199]MDT7516458.1 glycosyltransferase family 2 protein [Rhodoferax sp. TBRC 17199]